MGLDRKLESRTSCPVSLLRQLLSGSCGNHHSRLELASSAPSLTWDPDPGPTLLFSKLWRKQERFEKSGTGRVRSRSRLFALLHNIHKSGMVW